jgi:CTP:phosphocholine cytidylyltransferase-like protein
MYLVKDYLGDSYVTEADVYMRTNYFDKELRNSTYFTGIKKDFKNEWILKFDEKDKVYDIEIGDGTEYILSGVSYWSKKDADFIRCKIEEAIENNDFHNLFWDDIVRLNLKDIDVYVKEICTDDWFEIDSLEDLQNTEDYLEKINK